MKQAANFQKFRAAHAVAGITISTSPTDFYPIQSVQLSRFKGETWELFGDILSGDAATDSQLSLCPIGRRENSGGRFVVIQP